MIARSLISEELSSCCELDCFPVSLCSLAEKQSLFEFLPGCKTVIVLAHHVKSAIEWMWFPLESERNHVTCAADLHAKSECKEIIARLEENGYHGAVIPYPGRCGVRFKDIANKTGLGAIGDNFLFLHRAWGSWAHLRVIITDAEIGENLSPCKDVCIHCGLCKSGCPAKVIQDDTLLGTECDIYQDAQDESLGMQGNYIFKCEECARACPIGKAPLKLSFTK